MVTSRLELGYQARGPRRLSASTGWRQLLELRATLSMEEAHESYHYQ